ncbi:hypothetical protein V6Z11_A02G159600 [Gossypium hirsutum]
MATHSISALSLLLSFELEMSLAISSMDSANGTLEFPEDLNRLPRPRNGLDDLRLLRPLESIPPCFSFKTGIPSPSLPRTGLAKIPFSFLCVIPLKLIAECFPGSNILFVMGILTPPDFSKAGLKWAVIFVKFPAFKPSRISVEESLRLSTSKFASLPEE